MTRDEAKEKSCETCENGHQLVSLGLWSCTKDTEYADYCRKNNYKYYEPKEKTMTRDEAKELLPIIQAYSEGKEIEFNKDNYWQKSDLSGLSTSHVARYRIKPEPKYRPFKDAKEFEPFRDRWITFKRPYYLMRIVGYNECSIFIVNKDGKCNENWYQSALERLTFDDGTPFGIEVQDENN